MRACAWWPFFSSRCVGAPFVAAAQDGGGAYFEFLLARRLEGQGDFPGAQAALERAAKLDARSSEVWAELGAFHLRRSQPEDAEAAAKSALAIDSTSIEGHRVLGLVYAGYADGGLAARGSRGADGAVPEGRHHAPGAGVGLDVVRRSGPQLHAGPAVPARGHAGEGRAVADARGCAEPGVGAGTAAAGASPRRVNRTSRAAIATLEAIVDEEPRVAAALGQYQEQSGLLREAAATYTKALAVRR